jgi:hypothetical protein
VLSAKTTYAGTPARAVAVHMSTIADTWIAQFTVATGGTSVARSLTFTVTKR